MKKRTHNALKKIIILAVWLLIWQIVSVAAGLELLFASPVAVFKEFIVLMGQAEFYITAAHSFLRITGGFLVSAMAAVILGSFAGRYSLVKDFLAPVIHLMQSLPIAAFIILALMWFGSENISFVIGGMVVIPIVYTAVVQGIKNMDDGLRQMAQVFEVGLLKRVRYIYFPQIYPYVLANCRVALGMCWKAGVSAEVIGLASHSIGSQMYYAKLYLLSADLFVWSIVVIALNVLFERVFVVFMQFIKNVMAK